MPFVTIRPCNGRRLRKAWHSHESWLRTLATVQGCIDWLRVYFRLVFEAFDLEGQISGIGTLQGVLDGHRNGVPILIQVQVDILRGCL